jgi:hypothetical protein
MHSAHGDALTTIRLTLLAGMTMATRVIGEYGNPFPDGKSIITSWVNDLA